MKIKCDNCGKIINKNPARVDKSKHNYCCYKCMGEHRQMLYINENNPNKKYNFDADFFKNIDTEFKAWLLGWIASDGSIRENGVTIEIHEKDKDVLEIIQKNFCSEIPIKTVKREDNINVCYTWNSKQHVQDLLQIFNLKTGSHKAHFLNKVNISEQFYAPFLRGLFEGDGHVQLKSNPVVTITSSSQDFIMFLQQIIKQKGHVNCYKEIFTLTFCGVNALDFLGFIYEPCNFKMKRKYEVYEDVCVWTPILRGKGNSTKLDGAFVAKTSPEAVFPSKSRVSDSGYDLTIISEWKKVGNTTFYDTGIRVKPPFGFAYYVMARSSLSKTGYILTNSVGVIDRSYTGSIKIALTKIDNTMPDLQLPCRVAQLIPIPIAHFQLKQVDSFVDTDRGDGGFGSTSK